VHCASFARQLFTSHVPVAASQRLLQHVPASSQAPPLAMQPGDDPHVPAVHSPMQQWDVCTQGSPGRLHATSPQR